jgi:lipopolysaccharide heptosyltransferase II
MKSSPLRVATRHAVRRVAYLTIGACAAGYRMIRGYPPKPLPGEIRSILVIRIDLLGDVLFSTTAAEGLRRAYPDAHIAMLTLPYTAPLAALYPFIDEVISVDTNQIRTVPTLINPFTWIGYWGVYRKLRSRRFDLCLSLSGPMASLWAFLSGAPQTVGYANEAYPRLLTDPITGGRYNERVHEVEYVRRLAMHAGASDVPRTLDVRVPVQAQRTIAARLERVGIESHERLVVVHAGSVNGSAKRWPTGSWARFATEVSEAASVRIVLAGAKSDEGIAREVQAASGSHIASVVGDTTIEELIALLSRADLVATSDSGPLHLAVALGRPIVAPYGPTDPYVHGPYNPVHAAIVHRKDLACSPCYSMTSSAECPLGDPICMRLVSVRQMVESALAILG